MATAKKASKAGTTPPRKAAKALRGSAKAVPARAATSSTTLKPIKESFNKTSLINHLAAVAGQEPRL